jgi:hypothetical protein
MVHFWESWYYGEGASRLESLGLQTARNNDFCSLTLLNHGLLAASSEPLPAPMPIRLVYSSKDGCRPSFKDGGEVLEDCSFFCPVCQSGVWWDVPACAAVGTLGPETYIPSCGPLCHIASLKYPRRAGEDSCAGELLLWAEWVYFGNQCYYWGGGLWIKQENVSRLARQIRRVWVKCSLSSLLWNSTYSEHQSDFLYGLICLWNPCQCFMR